MASKLSEDIREKRRIMREIYGGMMTLEDVRTELGYGSPRSARKWIRECGLDGTRVSTGARVSVRYETDLVAKKIVEGRGMV